MSRRVALVCSMLAASAVGNVALASDLDKAPPPFAFRTGSAVPIDMETVEIDMTFDAARGRATASAHIVFKTGAAGMPFFDLVPNPTAVTVDNEPLQSDDFVVVSTPGNETRVRVVGKNLTGNATHEMTIDYPIPDVTFSGSNVRAGFFMSDLATSGREFFEQYGPANMEFDQVQYTFNVRLVGTSTVHEIFTNGDMTTEGDGAWTMRFPAYFTTSSIYFHLAEKGRFAVQRYTYDGLEADIPVTVYAANSSLVSSGVSRSRSVLAELEGTYGPFAHPRVVIYMTIGGGGMEYCGATMTEQSALGHELTHSYFARGVMPADGNSGWIDEAIASWRDDGYPRANGAPNRSPVNLGGFTPYRRHTAMAAYTSGAQLMSEFDYLFRSDGGLKPVLRQLFTEHKLTPITLPMFKSYVEGATGRDLTSVFRRYVLGLSSAGGDAVPEAVGMALPSHHPRPYTKAELELYR